MAVDRTIRSLVGIGGASSSRVLNLLAIGIAQAENPGYGTAPFFVSPILNHAIILKHRLRGDEADLFAKPRVLATKIIIPFEKSDLKVGGQSMFVGQRNFEMLLKAVGNYKDPSDMKQDMNVLYLIDSVPSLDPFLLREHLRTNTILPDACYFEISAADQQRMYDHTAAEIGRLSAMASGKKTGLHDVSTGRLVSALLSTEVNEKLEPLRATLGLNVDEFREGIFSWRGFIYYKWSLQELWPSLIRILKDLRAAEPIGKANAQQLQYLESTKDAIIQAVRNNSRAVRKIVAVYDNAYAGLIERHDPQSFRQFLLGAPGLFFELGEKIGAMSHVTSFWNYRFPPGLPRVADAEELSAILLDFAQSLGQEQMVVAA
jgi:hypothetical protein